MAKTLGSLPAGTLIKDTGTKYNGKPIIWRKEGAGHSKDPANSVILATRDIITIKGFDGREASNSNTNRQRYGNSRYLHSNLLQWLNSDKAANAWYSAQHSADAAPTKANCDYNGYNTEAGFLTNFSADLKAALLTVSKVTAKNTDTDGGGYESVSSKIFLESTTEVGLANENNIAEGAIYEYYSSNNTDARRIRKPTAEAVSKSDYTDDSLNANSGWQYWLRTPRENYPCYVRTVNTNGSLLVSDACAGGRGVVPACALSSSALVSDTTDSDGCYTLQFNTAPVINGSTSLGDKNASFDATFSITDKDGDAVSATVKLDGNTVQTIASVVLGNTYTLQVDKTVFRGLSNGSHSFVITATDSAGNSSTKTMTFQKVASTVTITGSDGSKGNHWQQPGFTYQVGDSAGSSVDIIESIDGTTTKTITGARLNTDIIFDLSSFASLSNEQTHTLKITATNESGTVAVRTWTFKKLPGELIYYTEPIPTDAAAQKINVVLNYSRDGNPAVKIEATNNARAIEAAWEDMTEAWKAGRAYEFGNTPSADFGIAIRVTITKNANTERVYVNSHGIAFA